MSTIQRIFIFGMLGVSTLLFGQETTPQVSPMVQPGAQTTPPAVAPEKPGPAPSPSPMTPPDTTVPPPTGKAPGTPATPGAKSKSKVRKQHAPSAPANTPKQPPQPA